MLRPLPQYVGSLPTPRSYLVGAWGRRGVGGRWAEAAEQAHRSRRQQKAFMTIIFSVMAQSITLPNCLSVMVASSQP